MLLSGLKYRRLPELSVWNIKYLLMHFNGCHANGAPSDTSVLIKVQYGMGIRGRKLVLFKIDTV